MTMDFALNAPPAVLRPSEYTAALIQVLHGAAHLIRGAHVLEIGSGSGVVLAALGALGAASMCGIDIEDDAVVSGMWLMGELGHGDRAEFHRGDLWRPVAGRRFDLVVANLPQFPMVRSDIPGRLPTWSAGGPDGRSLLDPYLEGLSDHLARGARSFITHNAFDGLERSREILTRRGLAMRVVLTTFVFVPEEKIHRMTPEVLRAETGRTIHRYGPYAFAELHIVEIAAPEVLG